MTRLVYALVYCGSGLTLVGAEDAPHGQRHTRFLASGRGKTKRECMGVEPTWERNGAPPQRF